MNGEGMGESLDAGVLVDEPTNRPGWSRVFRLGCVLAGVASCVLGLASLFWPYTAHLTNIDTDEVYDFDCGSPMLRHEFSAAEAKVILANVVDSRPLEQRLNKTCSNDLEHRPLNAGFMAVGGGCLLAVGLTRLRWKACTILLVVAGVAMYGGLPGLFSHFQHW
jgi:hypothetical protein